MNPENQLSVFAGCPHRLGQLPDGACLVLDAEEQVLESSSNITRMSVNSNRSSSDKLSSRVENLITVNGFALPMHGLMDFGLAELD